MLRTTIYLQEEVAVAVRQLAEVQRRPQAEIIRDAICSYVEKSQEELKSIDLPGIGAYHSQRSDISRKADELVRKAIRKGRQK